MLDLQVIADGKAIPLIDLPTVLGRRGAAREIGDTIDAMIALMDDLGGDPDLEDNGDLEEDGTAQGDPSWPEWHTRGRFKLYESGGELPNTAKAGTAHEDDEDDDPDTGVEDSPLGFDPEEDTCEAADDGCGQVLRHGYLYWGSERDDDGI